MELSVVTGDETIEVVEDAPAVVAAGRAWYRHWRPLVAIALVVAAVAAWILLANGRAERPASSRANPVSESVSMAPGKNTTIQQYIRESQITSTQIRRGDPGAPVIGMGLLPGWRSLLEDTPPWAYGAVEWDSLVDPNDPPTMVVLLFKLTGDVDPAKILEYAPGELENLPNYEPVGEVNSAKLSGYDATDLSGRYTRDGKERSIGQKTVVIPEKDAVYVLQINVDGLDGDTETLARASAMVDGQTTINP